ncbi:DUF5802 family protein [Halovenus rubra]|uniref:DUF5802 family protein n=2 Tax=Halovenus rubra TaxID=869890 RepID=A0ACC7E5T4_9EURY|nr:DUF5802 family protein [Halovenus rubra]
MFEQFSSGYYLGRLYVEPSSDETAKMCREQHEHVNEQLYADDEGIARLDVPLVMKIGSTHFAVEGSDGVPADTLAVPEGLLDRQTVKNPPTWSEVLLAKAEHASRLLGMATVGHDQQSEGGAYQ